MDLLTPRLRLRPFEAVDFDWLHPVTASATVTRYTDWGPNEPEDTEAFLKDAARSGGGPEEFVWAVTMPDGTGVGSAGVWVISKQHRRASFGYTLGSEFWGLGYATELASELVRFAVTGLGAHRVEATCHPENAASVRVLEKAGLKIEGRLAHHMFVRGEWRDSLLFATIAAN